MPPRLLLPSVAALATAVGTVALAGAAAGLPTALGAAGARLHAVAARAAATGSTHAADGLFHNTLPDPISRRGTLLTLAAVLRAVAARGPVGRPARPVPLAADLPPEPPAPLAATWYGHSSVLLEVDGCRVLADPV